MIEKLYSGTKVRGNLATHLSYTDTSTHILLHSLPPLSATTIVGVGQGKFKTLGFLNENES